MNSSTVRILRLFAIALIILGGATLARFLPVVMHGARSATTDAVKPGLWEVKWKNEKGEDIGRPLRFCISDTDNVSKVRPGGKHFHDLLLPYDVCFTRNYRLTGDSFTADVQCATGQAANDAKNYDNIAYTGKWINDQSLQGLVERTLYVDRETTRIRQAFRGLWLQATCDTYPTTNAPVYDAKRERPFPDMASATPTPATSSAKSTWIEVERARYEQLLTTRAADVLVVPIQVQEYGFDRAIRSLMTAQLASALSKVKIGVIADPYLVNRALDEGWRRFDDKKVYRLANKLKAKIIIWTYAGHDNNGSMAVTVIRRQHRSDSSNDLPGKTISQTWEKLTFTDENPPNEAFAALLPKVVEMLGYDPKPLAEIKLKDDTNLTSFPATPLALTTGAQSPIRSAYFFQLLAKFTPASMTRTRERFLEKSLLSLSQLSDDSLHYRALKARAYMGLGMRPAAVEVLRQPRSLEEQALLATLNGNLPELVEISAKLKSPVTALLAKLDLNAMRHAYGVMSKKQSTDQFRSIAVEGMAWRYLTQRSFLDWDVWTQYDNINVKRLLDEDLPIADFSLDSILRGQVALGNVDRLNVDLALSVTRHMHKLLQIRAASWCCSSTNFQPNESDYADLLEAIGTANLLRTAEFLTYMQGSYRRAMEFIDQLDPVYKEHPEFIRMRAIAESKLPQSSDKIAQQKADLKSPDHLLLQSAYWRQTTIYDYPPRVTEIGRLPQSGRIQNSQEKTRLRHEKTLDRVLKFSLFDFAVVRATLAPMIANADDPKRVLEKINGRFLGHPEREFLIADYYISQRDFEAAKAAYRSVVSTHSRYWPAYERLGEMLAKEGDYAGASKLFQKYPEFSEKNPEMPVAISNRAYIAGSLFFWRGELTKARMFYRVAANLRTGSDASLASELRLNLLKGDLVLAAKGSIERATRYSSTYAYRDYLSLLHVLGYSKEAWDAFPALIQHSPTEPHVWESALVGNRLAGTSESELIAWVKQPQYRQASKNDIAFATQHLVRVGMIDRVPSIQVIEAVKELEGDIIQSDPKDLTAINKLASSAKGHSGPPVLPAYPPIFKPTVRNPMQDYKARTRIPMTRYVKSDLVYMLESYTNLRNNDFQAANKLLGEATSIYDPFYGNSQYLLPYYAIAASKAGDSMSVKKLLAKNTHGPTFDTELAAAIMEGLDGSTKESIRHLRLALAIRPYTEERPILVEYQYAEICEWLFELTKQQAFRKVAIDWAKVNQQIQPWHSWAYAMEAKLTQNPKDRKRALGIALYLDKDSLRIRQFSSKEKAAAEAAFKRNNIFQYSAANKAQQKGI